MYNLMYEDLARARQAQYLEGEQRHGIQRSALRIGMEVRRAQRRQRRR